MIRSIKQCEIILYVEDQERSCAFYSKLFRGEPELHVPGMTEFILSDFCKIGLMPNKGIAKILDGKTPHPETGNGIPRCELYLTVASVKEEYEHALACGASLISTIGTRDWGDRVCYFADPDGHIIAFAEKMDM